MKAMVYTSYGSPDVLQLQEIAKPLPGDNEVLVRIYTTTVTPTDCAFLKADPFIIRFMNGLLKPRNKILGNLFAGEVEATGKLVTLFKPGDAIFGSTDTDFGAHAEYKCLPETGILALKPANMTYEEVVGVPEALTSLYFLKTLINVQPGQKILINGAAGAVGSYAVQLARYFGAVVTGVCSTRNLELVQALGADQVIDYTREDFTRNGEFYDVIFDVVGKRSFSECKGSLTPNGLYLSTAPGIGIVLQMLRTARFSRKKAILGFAGLNQNIQDLLLLKELVEVGKLKSVIDRCYPLEQLVEAYRYVETGHKRGNVVITVNQTI